MGNQKHKRCLFTTMKHSGISLRLTSLPEPGPSVLCQKSGTERDVGDMSTEGGVELEREKKRGGKNTARLG